MAKKVKKEPKKIWVIIHDPETYQMVPTLVGEDEYVAKFALTTDIYFDTKDQAEQWIDKVKYVAKGLRAGDAVLLKRVEMTEEKPEKVVKAISTPDPLPKPRSRKIIK